LLNRDHVVFPAVAALANARAEFIARLKSAFDGWQPQPVHASLFGSAARGDGDENSDIDIFLVRPGQVSEDDEAWQRQTDALTTAVGAWTGNPLSLIEFGDERVATMSTDVLTPMRTDGILLSGLDLSHLVDSSRSE
jgi:hypothetical protein